MPVDYPLVNTEDAIYLPRGRIESLDDDVFVDDDEVSNGTLTLVDAGNKKSGKIPFRLSKQEAFSQTEPSCDVSEQPVCSKPGDTPGITNIITSTKSRKKRRSFCWRHDFYELPDAPARPCSPSSEKSNEPSKDQGSQGSVDPARDQTGCTSFNTESTQHLVLHQKACPICRSQEEKRLDLRSRRASTAYNKVPAQPALAKVKDCPSNLLAEAIPNCSALWTENRTFYLGTDSACGVRNVEKVSRTRPRSVPSLFQLDKGKGQAGYIGQRKDRKLSRVYSFRIRSLSLNTTTVNAGQLLNGINDSHGRKDWLLVQRVVKKILKDCTDFEEVSRRAYYCELGPQEMIFCLYDMRSISYIRDLCCQHFLSESYQEALDRGRMIELLFSSQGPVLRDDGHIKGRSIFYFCCHVEITSKPKQKSPPVDLENQPIDLTSFAAGGAKSKKVAKSPQLSHRRKHRRSSSKSLATAAAAGNHANELISLSETADQDQSETLEDLVSFSIDASQHNLPATALASSGDQFHTLHSTACSANAFHASPDTHGICALGGEQNSDRRKKKRGGDAKRTKRETMRKSSNKENNPHGKKPKKVTFSDEVKGPAKEEETASGVQSTVRGSYTLPPPKLKLAAEEEDDSFVRRKRRESVAISFAEVPIQRTKKEKVPPIAEAPPVTAYQHKQWKTLKIVVAFKDQKFANEFLEHKTLQDLYTWLRQEFLKREILTAGADLLLSYENLKFPLKANTATSSISSLPSTVFRCEEILKTKSGDAGFRESASKYDTRFALPIDTRELEGLTPVQYLGRFCIVSGTWKAFYLNIFASFDRYRNNKLNYREVCAAMERLFVELAHPLLRRVIDLMGLNASPPEKDPSLNVKKENRADDWKANFSVGPAAFVSMCSLANRIICRENEIDGFPVDTIRQSGTQLEDADFYNIEGKICDYDLHPLTKRLLLYVRNKSD